MKSFEQFLEDAPVRTYNDPSVIASPEARRRAGRREIERDYGDKLDTQAAAAVVRKPSVETEKEKKFGIGSSGTHFDKSGAAGTKEDDRKPLELRPKRIRPKIDELKDRFAENLSAKEGIIPINAREALDKFTKEDLKEPQWKLANDVLDSISGKHPVMDLLSVANTNALGMQEKDATQQQKRLIKLKELIDNDDPGELDDAKVNPILKLRSDLKDKAYKLTDRMDAEGFDPFEFLPDLSQSEELMSDFNVEENDINYSGDFVPLYWRQISKALEGLPNHQVREFLNSIDITQRKYKKGDNLDFSMIGSWFNLDDEGDINEDMMYEGLNTNWYLSPEYMGENNITPQSDDIDGDNPMREVAWNNIIVPNQIENLKDESTEQILTKMLTVGNQDQQQRIMAMLSDYLDRSGLSIKDALEGEGLWGFGQHIRRTTALDALRTWREQIVPDLQDGQVLRNTPAYGGRDGNARERMYKKAGFGELLSDDYQYGQKVEGESKLKPLDETDINTFDEEAARNDVADTFSEYLPDDSELPFERWEFYDQVEEYFEDQSDYNRFRDDPEGVFQDIYDNLVYETVRDFDFDVEEYIRDEMLDKLDEEGYDDFVEWARETFRDEDEFSRDSQTTLLSWIRNEDDEKVKKIAQGFLQRYLWDKSQEQNND